MNSTPRHHGVRELFIAQKRGSSNRRTLDVAEGIR